MKGNKVYVYFFILFLLTLKQSYQDCSDCTITDKQCQCSSNQDCRWMKIKSNEEAKCLICNDISKGESNYYSRQFTVDNEPYCHIVGKTGYSGAKIIFGTKQIVNNCKELGLYSLGDFCYDTCPDNSNDNDNSNYICKCENLYYKEIKEGLTYINCLGNADDCPSEYYYINDKECLKSCPKDKPYLYKDEAVSNKNYLCKEECLEYKYLDSFQSTQVKYCFNQCPSNAQFYYEDKVCIDKCSKNTKDFYNSNKKCIDHTNIKSSDCGSSYYINVFPDDYIFQCVEINEDNLPCPTEFSYKFIKEEKIYCLKSCEDTNIDFFNNVKTYLYNKEKECIDINGMDSSLFMIEKEKRIVDDCSEETYWPYHEGNKCVTNCGNKYIDNESNECLDNCKSNYYKDEETKICFKDCPDYLGRGFYNDNKKCVACGINGEGSGFHKENEDKKCYSQCPDNFRHNYLNNICFEGECKNHEYKYSYDGDQKTCYYTCKDIGEEYIIEKDYKCYKQIDDSFSNYYFYETTYGIKKYMDKTSAVKECFTQGLKYLRNNECVEKCNENEYKVESAFNQFGLCYNTVSECKSNDYKFYNNSKICSKNCDYYTIGDNTGNIKVNEENCLINCPSDYPYLDGKICKQECNECYIEEDGIKKCVPKDNYFIQKIDGHNKCVKYCTNSITKEHENGIPIFSYYNSNKICLDTCIGNQGAEFSYEAINTHQECKSECPNNEYYYDNKKICLKKCDKYIKEKGSKICVDKCENGEYILPGNICSDQCEKDAPFFIKEEISNGDNSFEIYKCVQSCALYEGYPYFNSGNKECLSEIPNDMANFVIYNGGLYEECPNELSAEPEDSICKTDGTNLEGCTIYKTSSSSECLPNCPIGEHFIDKNDNTKCLSKCEDSDFYVKEKEMVEYTIYKCVGSCSGEKPVYINDSKECIENCGNLYELDGVCYFSCVEPNYDFSTYDSANHKYICSEECDSEYPFTEENKKICEKECSFISSRIAIIKTDSDEKYCVNKCEEQDNGYNYLQIKEEDNKLYCLKECPRYDNEKKICMQKCQKPKNYVNNNECLTECPNPNDKFTEIDGEYICSTSCETAPFFSTYKDSNLCLQNCYSGDYLEEEEKICTNDCNLLSSTEKKYYFYESDTAENPNKCVLKCEDTDKQFTRKNNHCDNECDSNPLGDYYYLEGTFKCIEKSDCAGKKIDGRICREDCSSIEKYTDDDEEYCLSNCYYSTKGYIYYEENQYICKNEFKNYIINNNIFKSECSDNFYNDDQCIIECPKGKKFIINDNKCLDDCSQTIQYYTEETIQSKKVFQCKEECKAYAFLDINKNSKLCLGDTCSDDYPYYITDEIPKECFKECPSEYNYYYISDNDGKFKCIKSDSVPEGYVLYKNTNKYIKKVECNPNYINFETNECISKCSENQVIYIKKVGDDTYNYCSNNCEIFGEEELKLDLNGQECVTSCSDNEQIISLDNNIKKCDCENLFYIDISSGLKKCINKNEINCIKQFEYPYLIKGTNQCNNVCEGIISLNGSDCYTNNDYNCPENSHIKTLSNGIKQCECDFKYYYFETENSKEIYCLPKDSKCPRNETFNRELFINETKECVEYCPFDKQTKKFGKTCVKLCPIMTVVVNDECFCQDKWYMNEKDEMICTKECPLEKPIMIDETKECVNTCINTEYPVFYRNKCYLDCTKFPETIKIDDLKNIENIENHDYKGYFLFEKYGEYGDSICYCKGPWYEDGNNYGCNENKESSCDVFKNEFAYKYEVIPTKQCVKECPKDFNFSFNEFCFKSCEQGNSYLSDYDTNSNKKIIDGDSNICKCKNLWKYEEDDISKIVCLEEETCNDNLLLIVSTNECYNGIQCREENPLLFNKKCYNKDNCPENSIFKEAFPNTCSCVKYYYESNGEIFCLAENEDCKEEYPYLIYSENKCVKENDEELNDLYNFNRIYYSNCPYLTKVSNDNNNCICDILYGYWYKDSDNNLYCGRRECPQEKSNYIADTRECIANCSSDGYNYVEYNGICYDECPELTEENKDKKCEIKKTIDSNNSTELTEVIKDNIVSLYKASKKEENENENEEEKEKDDSNIIELVNCNLTVEFYGVNNNKKENKKNHNNKNKVSASLSYIDLSECMQEIYENNNMRPDDDIIILKYDITNTPKEYLINPVEYKLINSRNGQELDASACGKASIKISYPFNNIMNNYDKISKKRNLKTIMIDIKNDNGLITLSDKYNIGKEINAEYSYIDTFNSKDNIYTDYCSAVEINGKDLVLEDRMNYLLPHYSLCERNCTYNHTDFEEERIYCDCPFKNEFDVEREHQAEIDLNENAVIQSQGGETNFPVLKCISVLGDSKRIKKNIAFYYMLIIIIIEICLLTMTILFGINSFKLFFGKAINDNDINNENDIELKIDEKDKDKKYGEEIIRTTERNLNAPPIKNNKTENEEENKEENKNEEKNNNNNEENEIEFIPDEFLFLYFNEKDKGIRKKVEKELLPFSINKKTKILLQKMENVDYTNVKAAGPFQEDQNLIEVVGNDEEKVNINIESINESIIENDKIKITEKNKINNKLNEKDIIPIKEETIYKRKNLKNYIINDLDEVVEEKEKEIENKKAKSLLDEIKIEQRLLTKDYEFASNKNECDLFTLILTEILDKIYIVKNILFIRKYEIMYLYLSVYALYHLILLTFLAMFYNIKTIKNIWNKENYPGMGLYFGYAFLSLIISWIIYILFICLLSNKGKYNEIMSIKNSKKKKKGNKMQLLKKKVNSLLSKMKTKIIIYYIVQFIIIILFFIYLVTLCAVYSGTMNKIFASYGVAILEIIIIKIIYGLILAILRYSSLSSQKRGLYNCVLFLDKYIV